MSANLGSVASLVGNPQNMIIGHMSAVGFIDFSAAMLPVAVAGLAIQAAILCFGFRRTITSAPFEMNPPPQHAAAPLGKILLSESSDPRQTPGRRLRGSVFANPPPVTFDRALVGLTITVLVLVFAGFSAGLHLAWTALAGGVLVMVLARRDTHEVLKLVDWHLILFFAALFIVVDGLTSAGLPDQIFRRIRPMFGSSAQVQAANLSWFAAVGSNIFSNVPFVLVAGKWIANFAEPELMWKVLAMSTTFAGNLTILGSVANIIVVESARDHVEVGFWDYAKYGLPITVLTTATGLGILLWLGR
jgi:Na+/H+ antiporter NhaD/arsenite permease-like protein